MNRLTKLLGAVAVALFAVPALAQQQAQPQQQEQIAVSDAEMREFVKVHNKVVEVSETYLEQMEAASSDQAKVDQIREQANKELTEIVEGSPIGIQKYTQIAHFLPLDKKLQEQYQKQAN